MTTEQRNTPGALPAAATVALLTLQLRAALREAEQAEAAEAAIDLDAARAEMRQRLDALVAERRTALDLQIADARQAASEVVESAHCEAELMLADATRLVEEASLSAPALEEPVPPEPVTEPEPEPVAEDVDERAEQPLEAVVVLERAVESAVARSLVPVIEDDVDPWAVHGLQADVREGSPVVTVDAEAFAKVFATVLATVLDERFAAWRAAMVESPMVLSSPQQTPSASQQSPKRSVFHLDFVLMALAAAIVVVLLFAWLG